MQIGIGSGATVPPGPQSRAMTCWPSPGGRKRTPSPLGGEHPAGPVASSWTPRGDRSAGRRLMLLPAPFRGSRRYWLAARAASVAA
jgi:hypothetical protein